MDRIVKVGRRKTSVARVFLNSAANPGQGTFTINRRTFEEFIPIDFQRLKVMAVFETLEIALSDFDIMINVNGGGITGQTEAIRLGICRALLEVNEEYRGPLKRQGFLTRDSRMVERKKYGQPKARKKTQFSKR